MRQLTFLGPGKLEWRDVPQPTIQTSDDAIVRSISVATCDLDGAFVQGRVPIPGPFALGHECVAQVLEVGADVRIVRRGDQVICPFQISCGRCERCLRGLTGNCETAPRGAAYGMGVLGGDWGGALSDLLRVPFADAMLVKVEPGSERLASLADNVPDGWRTVDGPLEQRPASPVLILSGDGPGSIPLYAVAAAIALGSSRVDYVDFNPKRLAIAESFGAHPVEIAKGEYPKKIGSWPVTVDSTANEGGLACAINSTEPGGVCTSTGIYFGPSTPMPLLGMYTKGITFVTGRVHARPIMEPILKAIADGKLQPEKVTTETAHWDDAIDALMSYTTKLVVTRDALTL